MCAHLIKLISLIFISSIPFITQAKVALSAVQQFRNCCRTRGQNRALSLTPAKTRKVRLAGGKDRGGRGKRYRTQHRYSTKRGR